MNSRPTMNDVAREAGVALKTVSRFVNGETNIDPLLGDRIASAIARLGYRRNLSAASIRPGWSSKMIGLVISDLANPYYANLARGVERVATAAGYMVMTSSSEERGSLHDRVVDRMLDQRVDGLIVVPPRETAKDWSLFPPPIPPLVFVDRPNEFRGGHVILADNRGGARRAVSQLIQGGAQRIAFLGDSLDIYTMRERHAGYLDALNAADVAFDRRLSIDVAHTATDAARSATALLSAGKVDAVFAANNRSTFGVLQAIRDGAPAAALIGFDDFEGADLMQPGVSVVGQNVTEMGELAARMVLAAIAGESKYPRVTTLDTVLILRGSEIALRD